MHDLRAMVQHAWRVWTPLPLRRAWRTAWRHVFGVLAQDRGNPADGFAVSRCDDVVHVPDALPRLDSNPVEESSLP